MKNYASVAWRLMAALSFLAMGDSNGDSINLDLEVVENIDLSALGEEGLEKHKGTYELTVDEDCMYLLKFTFVPHSSDNMNNDAARYNFQGDCSRSSDSGLHEPNRNWLQFKEYVKDTTGFHHMSLYPRPCGLEPLGRRQARYDVNFYRVPAHYRTLWICQTFNTPEMCVYDQPSFLGRGHFTVPRLHNHADLIPNTPRYYQPDPDGPEAHPYEGLFVMDQSRIPASAVDFSSPNMDITTYDGDFASWRAILPYHYISDQFIARKYWGLPVYEFDTIPNLPSLWNVTYEPGEPIEVYLTGKSNLCGEDFDNAKARDENK